MAAPASAALPSFSYRLLWELILTAGTSELHTKQLLNDCWCNEVTPDLYWFWLCHSELQTTAVDILLLTWPRTADARAATPRNGRAEQQKACSASSSKPSAPLSQHTQPSCISDPHLPNRADTAALLQVRGAVRARASLRGAPKFATETEVLHKY